MNIQTNNGKSRDDTARVPAAGIDASPERRPGVPMESEPPRPAGNAHWDAPERQPDPGNILKRKGLSQLTPVFGTSVEPRGLSGLIRRAAYRVPEHYTSHWFALLLADRIDAVEDRVSSLFSRSPARASGPPLKSRR